MKYTSKIKSEQTIQIGDKKSITLVPGKGEISDAEALAVAKSPWGKRLIKAGYLTFAKKIEVKEEDVQRGMTIKPGEKKGKKPSPQGGGDGDTGDSNTGGGGDENTDKTGDGDDANSAGDEGGDNEVNDNEIPDFDENAEGGNGEE